jgi:serine/threonine protein kinase
MSKAEAPKPEVAAPPEVPSVIVERVAYLLTSQTKAGTVVNEYKRGMFLGKGGFARVYMVKDVRTGLLYAVKVIERSKVEKSTSRKAKVLYQLTLSCKLRFLFMIQ